MIALLVRCAALLLFGENLHADPDAYFELATQLATEGQFGLGPDRPTAFRPPLYPLVLAPLTHLARPHFAIALLHLACGALTVWGTMVLARRAELGRAAAWAGLVVACDPLLVYQANLVMTETLATLLAVLLLLALDQTARSARPWPAVGAGLLLGLSILCRPTFLIAVPLMALAMLLPQAGEVRWRKAALLIVGTIACLAPWTLRNWIQLGAPVYATTHGGYTLWLANNPSYYDSLRDPRPGRPWSAAVLDAQQRRMMKDAGGDEVAADRAAFRAALRTIRQEPKMFLASCAVRLGQFFSPLPNQLSPNESTGRWLARHVVAVWYVAVFLFALRGLLCLRGRLLTSPWLWGLVLVVSFALVHTFFWSNLRMRAPVMPVIALWGAAATAWLDGACGRWINKLKR